METLPNEVLLQICENLDIKELGRLRRTSEHNYQVCKEVLRKRIIEDFESGIRNLNLNVKTIASDGAPVILTVERLKTNSLMFIPGQEDKRNTAKITQTVQCRSWNCFEFVKWPLPYPATEYQNYGKGYGVKEAAFNPNDSVLVRSLAEFLADQGYTRF